MSTIVKSKVGKSTIWKFLIFLWIDQMQ